MLTILHIHCETNICMSHCSLFKIKQSNQIAFFYGYQKMNMTNSIYLKQYSVV